MKRRIEKWIILGMILALPMTGFAESASQTGETKTDSGLEITINGVPIEEVIGSASEAFAGAVEKNVNEAVGGINAVLGEFAQGFSESLEGIEGTVDSMINDSWYLNIPAIGLETEIKRSMYDNALDLYQARIDGEAGKDSLIAKDMTEDCGNRIIYIYDKGQHTQAVLDAVENGSLDGSKVLFGSQHGKYEHRILSVLYLSPSDKPFAMCNMSDLQDGQKFAAFADYIAEHAIRNYDEAMENGGPLVTIVFQNGNSGSGWLTVVVQEEASMLE